MTSTEFTVGATDRANKILAFDSNGEISVTQELGSFKGNWSSGTDYVGRDIVKDTSTNNIFLVNTAHTSSGSQPLTTNTNSAKYDLIVDAASATTSQTAAASSATAAKVLNCCFIGYCCGFIPNCCRFISYISSDISVYSYDKSI